MQDEAFDIYQKIRPFVKKEILENQNAGLYDVNNEYHTHNGIDSPLIDTLSGGNAGAGGSNTQIQYNNLGLLAGSPNLTFDDSTNTLSVPLNITNSLGSLNIHSTGDAFLTADGDMEITSLGTTRIISSDTLTIGVQSGIQISSTGVFQLTTNSMAGSAAAVLDTSLVITADKTFQFPNKNGTFAMLSDVTTTPPGGNNTNIQFNNSAAFGGSDNLTWDGSSVTITSVSPNIILTSGLGGGSVTQIKIKDATASNTGGDALLLLGSNANGNGDGGEIDITAGSADAAGNGGSIFINPGINNGGVDGTVNFLNPTAGQVAILDTSLITTTDKTFTLNNSTGGFVVADGNTTTTAPTTNAGTPTTRYGGNTKYLGDPVAWIAINIAGTSYKLPLYQ